MTLEGVLPLLIPLLAIQLTLIVIALRDLLQPGRRVRGDSRIVWALIIIGVSIIGPILYLVWGRREE